MLIKILSALCLSASLAQAAKDPNAYKTLGNPTAPQGGTFYYSFEAEPESINPITSTDIYATEIQKYVMSGLMELNLDTYEFEPGLAERYEEGKGGLEYTFFLRPDAKFHDGKPVTAEDVKFSFDAVKNPAFKAAHRIPYYENIEKVEVVNPTTVRFILNKKYFGNFETIVNVGDTPIAPKHIYGDPKKKLNKILIGSGPYKLETYDKGKNIVLAKNKEWFGNNIGHLKGKYNFDKHFIRFVSEENLEVEMLKKGQLDFLGMTPEAYVQKTQGAPFGTSILKKQVENQEPKGYGFVGWNNKSPLFKDRETRVALSHLMNRPLMNEKFRFNMSLLATGPWYNQSPYVDPSVKAIEFSPEKAKALLTKAGWKDENKDGTLERTVDGQKRDFRFSLLLPSRDAEKYFTLYKEDLKKAGIDMEIKIMEWNAFIKAMDDRKFDAVTLSWGGGSVNWDPKQIWHTESARANGSNFISYSNPEADKLIDEGRLEMDRNKRIQIYRKLYKIIADDAPYTFMFVPKFALYAHHKKIGMVKPTYGYYVGRQYWWMGE